MLRRIREARENESGFTLIELLIVIIILGILAAIVVFAVGGITDRGNTAACKSDFKSVEIAQEAKFAQTGSYSGDGTMSVANVATLTPNYLKEAPSSTKYTIATNNTGAVQVWKADGSAVLGTGTTAACPA